MQNSSQNRTTFTFLLVPLSTSVNGHTNFQTSNSRYNSSPICFKVGKPGIKASRSPRGDVPNTNRRRDGERKPLVLVAASLPQKPWGGRGGISEIHMMICASVTYGLAPTRGAAYRTVAITSLSTLKGLAGILSTIRDYVTKLCETSIR